MANETADTTVAVVDERTVRQQLGEQSTVVGASSNPATPPPISRSMPLTRTQAQLRRCDSRIRRAACASSTSSTRSIHPCATSKRIAGTPAATTCPPPPRYIRSAWTSPSRRRAGRRRKAQAIRPCRAPRRGVRADYGVLLEEWRLLQRAVVVIGPDDRVVYAELRPHQMAEPDYDAAIRAITHRT